MRGGKTPKYLYGPEPGLHTALFLLIYCCPHSVFLPKMFEPTSLPALPTGSSVSPPRKEESLQEGILILALDLR